MGNSDSTLGGSSIGLHVLALEGPAAQSGLETFFDYITHINGQRIDESMQSLKPQMIGNALNLIVYSSKSCTLRNLQVVPTKQNGIGVKGRYCDFATAHERVWKILEVQANSPAFEAGLVSQKDYILGSRNGLLKQKNDFFNLIKSCKDSPLTLIVYNLDEDLIREVIIVPSDKWEGDGLLGCDIGYGRMHRIALSLISDEPAAMVSQDHPHHDHSHDHSHEHHDHSHDHSHEHHDHSHDHSYEHQDHNHALSKDNHDHSHNNHNHEHDHHDHHDNEHAHSHGHKNPEQKSNTNDHNHSHEDPASGHSHDHSTNDHSHDHSSCDHSHDHGHDHSNNSDHPREKDPQKSVKNASK